MARLSGIIFKDAGKILKIIGNYGRVLITFMAVCFAWIFFRAQSLADASYIIKNLFVGAGEQAAGVTAFIKGQAGLSSALNQLWPGVAQLDFLIAMI